MSGFIKDGVNAVKEIFSGDKKEEPPKALPIEGEPAKLDEITPEQKQEQKVNKEFEEYVNSLIEEAKKQGYDDEGAKKWAWRKIDKQIEKQRKVGQFIACRICQKAGNNKETGGMVKNPDGSYQHQNCGVSVRR